MGVGARLTIIVSRNMSGRSATSVGVAVTERLIDLVSTRNAAVRGASVVADRIQIKEKKTKELEDRL